MNSSDVAVAVIGGGVLGCAVAHGLARRGVAAVVLEVEPGLGLAASGTNSGILHTGFDSQPGALETRLILRSAELRSELSAELGIEVWRCGARLTPVGEQEHAAVRALADNAQSNGVAAQLDTDGALRIPGEGITDPVAYVHALAEAAQIGGAEIKLGAKVCGLGAARAGLAVELAHGERLQAAAVVNCGGLYADEIARLAGEAPVAIYPRKGEFLVFRPAPNSSLEEILLPVPSSRGKGVLVFPTVDGHVIAGPTAREREDKHDWSVEPDARELIEARALAMYPALAGAELVDAYAGLRPAGRDANYVIEHSATLPGLIHVAAIRSTGLSSSLGIAELVCSMLAASGAVALGEPRALQRPGAPTAPAPWWQRAARHHNRSGAGEQT
jgi:glycerol-3-phosphate dehydrogenase